MTDSINDLRVELRTKNNVLWHAIFDKHASVSEFCRAHGFNQVDVGLLLNLRNNPWTSPPSRFTKLAERLAEVVGIFVEDLFPQVLYDLKIPKRIVAEIPSSAYRGLNAAKNLALPPAEDPVLGRELREAFHSLLETMNERDSLILRQRFGLDDGEERSLEDIAVDLKISPERVRQIEMRALRKLRHPSRLRKLKGFL